MKKLWFVLIITLLLITTVNAAEDFDAFGQPALQAFQCTTHESTLTVINSGTEASTYFLEVEGSAARWVSFAPASFSLSPGQSIEVKSYLAVPCDAKGDYTLDIYIVTAYGLEKAILQDIYVEKPLNIDMRANVFSQSINPCQTARYNITIINPAEFTEEYTFSTDQFKNETYYSTDKLTIPAKSSKDVIIEIEPTQCDLSGEFDILFTAKAEKTGILADIDLFLKINNTGIARISEGINNIKTDYAEKGVELELTNEGDSTTQYTIRSEGTGWVSVQPDTLTVDPRKAKKFTLLFKPTNSTEQGKYPIKIVAVADTGAEYSKEINVQLGEPNVIDTLVKEYPAHTLISAIVIAVLIILIIFLVLRYTSEEAKIARAKKKAERAKEKAKLKAEREKQKKLMQLEKEKQKRIKEQEKKKKEHELEAARKKAIKKYDQKIKSEYQLISKKDIVKGKKLPSRWLANLIIFIILVVIISVIAQFRAFFWENIPYVIAGVVILIVIIILRWLGTKKKITARWRGLTLANETLLVDVNWNKGLQQASFMLSAPAKKLNAVIKRGRTRHSRHFRPKDFVYQYFRAKSSVDEVKESKFRFRVSKKWLEKREIKPKDVSLAILKGDTYQKAKTTRENSDGKYIYYKATASDFGQFAIVGTTSAKERYRPYWIAWLVIAVLFVIATGVAAKMYTEESIHAKGIPVQVWNQDEQHQLNLKKYFTDPDDDPLTFSVTKAENIDIQIRKGIAYFTPDFEWSGQRIITFTAEDNQGGIAQSNPVKLVVKKNVIPKSMVGYLKYILAGAIILIALILFLVLRKPVMKWMDEEEI